MNISDPSQSSATAEPSTEFSMAVALREFSRLRGKIRDEVETAQNRLLDFCEKKLSELKSVSQTLESPSTLSGVKEQRVALRTQFLDPTAELVKRKKPHRQVYSCLERFHRNRAEILRLFPEAWSGSEFQGFEDSAPLVSWGKPRELDLRRRADLFLKRADRARVVLEDALIVDTVGVVKLLLSAWESLPRRKDLGATVSLLQNELVAKKVQLLETLEAWDRLGIDEEKRLVKALLKRPRSVSKENESHRVLRGGVLRSIESDLALQQSFEKAWTDSLQSLESLHQSLLNEQTSLSQAKDEALRFLQDPPATDVRYPTNKVRIAPARSRCEDFFSSCAQASSALPPTLELMVVKKLSNSPAFRWSSILPRRAFMDSFQAQEVAFLEVAQDVISLHLSLFQEMERAQDVVDFATESSTEEDGEGVLEEAFSNATKLLGHFDRKRLNWVEKIEKKWVAIFEESVEEYYDRLGRDRLGFFRFILSKGGVRGARSAWKITQKASRHAMQGLSGWKKETSENFLVGIGWKTLEQAVMTVPERRALLPKEYLRDSTWHLPAIYQRLFKVEPLEDTRFLVSRGNEMEALAEALSLWKSGRSAAVLLSGQRGSGKTSLLNCARMEVFNQESVRQIEPVERLTTREELLDFLRESLELGSSTDVVESIQQAGGVIVLEEVERLFLREVGGYEAIATLLDVVTRTQNECLWVLSINEVSLRLLERVFQLSGCFTHRIRASGVSSEALTEAVMIRHNLSGLRLKFDPVSSAKHAKRLKRRTGAEQQAFFFRQLSERSSGVYRTALELWLGHIRLVEAGVLFMRPFHPVDSGPLLSELGQDDLFRLVAILQHGSLDSEELARIFSSDLASSRTALDELLGRELIESEPSRPGFRIRPEALPVVKEALYRKNLL